MSVQRSSVGTCTPTPILSGCNFLLTVGSFLLAVQLLCLQLG